jgi:urease accessory protein
MNMKRLALLSAGTLLALTTGAMAHTGHGTGQDLAHGFMHPLGGLDHLIAMVAVGVFAAQLGGRATYLVPVAFVLAMIAGGAAGYAGLPLPLVEQGIGLSVVALSVAVALGVRLPLVLSMGLVGLFAVFHGHAHGAEGADAAAFLPYAAGFVLATSALHIAGIALGLAIDRFGSTVSLNLKRLIGAAGAVAGVMILAG